MEPVGQNKTSGTERGIAGGDGAGDNAEHGERDAHAAHGLGADIVNSGGTAAAESEELFAGVESAAGSSPDQSDDTLRDHCAVEDEVALLLALHAASHQGALRGMEAGDRAAGDGDEHEAPDRSALRVEVGKVVPDLGDLIALGEDTQSHAERHNDQADTEQGVNLTDDLVDGQERCDEVVDQDQDQPEQLAGHNAGAAAVGEQQLDQTGRADRKDRTDHDEQHHAEHTHDVLHRAAEVDTGDLGDGSAFVTLAHHTGEIVVNRTGKNRTESDPQENHRAPQSAAQSAEDRAETRDVQKLDHKQLPLRQNHVVHAIVDLDSRRFTVVRAEGLFDDATVNEVAADQQCEADQKAKHFSPPILLQMFALQENFPCVSPDYNNFLEKKVNRQNEQILNEYHFIRAGYLFFPYARMTCSMAAKSSS